MRPKSLLLLALALGCGLVASIGISQVLDARRGSGKTGTQTSICIALADIDRTEAVSSDNAVLKPWPSDDVPAGAVTKLADVIGRRPNMRIVKGEPILMSKLGSGDGESRAAPEIPKDYRVVTVHVNNTENAGLILPGDRVDVQVYAPKGPDVRQTSARTFLEDVSVFAVNAETHSEKSATETAKPAIEARTISLLVTPKQADLVTLASEMGKIRLIMRGTKPEKTVEHELATVDELFGSGQETGLRPTPMIDTTPKPQEVVVPQPVKPAPIEEESPRMVVVAGTEMRIAEFRKGESTPHWLPVDSANWPASQTAPAADSGPEKPATPDKEPAHDKQPPAPASGHGHGS